jgi:hypothetical protein
MLCVQRQLALVICRLDCFHSPGPGYCIDESALNNKVVRVVGVRVDVVG